MGLLTGAGNLYAGSLWMLDPSIAGMMIEDLCISGDFVVTAEDPSVYPITLEFRIENNNCGAFPCPHISFDVVMTADGSLTIESMLSAGTVGPAGTFNPAGINPTLVTAIGNYSGGPMPAGITISYSNISLTHYVCDPLSSSGPPNVPTFVPCTTGTTIN